MKLGGAPPRLAGAKELLWSEQQRVWAERNRLLCRGLLVLVLTVYVYQVGAIVFAPVHVDSGAEGSALREWLEHWHELGWLPTVVNYDNIERAANVVMFFPGGVLTALLLPRSTHPYLMVCGYIISAVIETIQHFMPGRTADIFDVVMNGAGAMLGVLAVRIGYVWVERKNFRGAH